MKKIIQNILPPYIFFLLKKIYFFYLLKNNKNSITKDHQDIKIYNDPITAEKLEEWGKDSVWNEIMLLFNGKNGKILDVACGTGKNILDLKILNPQASFYGCDISQFLINIAASKGIDIKHLKCIDATKLDYKENFFDYSYSIGSLEHFTDEGIDNVIEKLYYTTRVASFHMMPVSKKNYNEGWIKTYQTFHNNSTEWWINKFKKKFKTVYIVDSSWSDFISNGKWFLCYK
jgi:ubiquinone/menaquinone biosynthesis C-methylase UbiE